MNKTVLIFISLFFVILAIGISLYLYQESKNNAAQIQANKIAALNSSISGTLAQGTKQSGIGGWLSGIFGTALTQGGPLAATAIKTGLI